MPDVFAKIQTGDRFTGIDADLKLVKGMYTTMVGGRIGQSPANRTVVSYDPTDPPTKLSVGKLLNVLAKAQLEHNVQITFTATSENGMHFLRVSITDEDGNEGHAPTRSAGRKGLLIFWDNPGNCRATAKIAIAAALDSLYNRDMTAAIDELSATLNG